MQKHNFVILEVNANTLHILVGRQGVSDTFLIAGESVVEYAGFTGGMFNEPDRLAEGLRTVIAEVEAMTKGQITKVYVGVPTAFCRSVIGESAQSFSRPHRITANDVSTAFKMANKFGDKSDLLLINQSPVYFATENDRKLNRVIGEKVLKLTLKAAFVFAERSFIETMNHALGAIGVVSAEYLCEPLAEMQFLFDDAERAKPVVLIDVGSGDTSVIIGQGAGLLSIYSFEMGGEIFATDLSLVYHLSYDVATALKEQIVLTLDAGIDDQYAVSFRNKPHKYSALDVNGIVRERINEFGTLIKRCLDTNSASIAKNSELYMTGDGLLSMRGAKEILAKSIGYSILPVFPRQPLLDKPKRSKILSLLALTLDINRN